jgi:large subunit ribosomal protein L5
MAEEKKAKGAKAAAGTAKPEKAPKPEKSPKAEKGGKGAKAAAQAGPVVEGRPHGPAEKPRLARHYLEKVRSALVEKFKYKSAMQAPHFEKIVINMGVGDAIQDQKLLDAAVVELTQIAGQRPAIRRAKKAISNFKLREGVPIGCAVTLRGARMYEFLDRFITVSVPRMRDFRGLPTKSFDGRGNYTVGIKEQMLFPEIDYDKVEQIHGMDITFVTNAGRDDTAMALLREMGMPFRGESPVAVG